MLLEVKDLEVHYGVINAIKKISFNVEEGEIVALIGANGAGKTSTMHAISGLLNGKSGDIIFNGENIMAVPLQEEGAMHIGYITNNKMLPSRLVQDYINALTSYVQQNSIKK